MPILARNMSDLIFIDESHFISLDQWKDHGWYERGSHPLAFRQNLWDKQSCSLLMAIGFAGCCHHVIIPHKNCNGVNQNDFLEFMLHLHRTAALRYIFVMDNARIHKSKFMKRFWGAMKREGRRIVFQAKYSPELNPIEYVFGFLKRRLKQHDQEPRDLYEDVELCVQTLTSEECEKTINHVFGPILSLPVQGNPQ